MNNSIILSEEEQDIINAIESGIVSGSWISDVERKNLAKIVTHTMSVRKF